MEGWIIQKKPGTANADDLRSAIDAILLDVEILEPKMKTFGCSIKWAWKNEWAKKVNEDWEKMPVNLEEISEQGVRVLMKNDSKRLWFDQYMGHLVWTMRDRISRIH